MDRTEATRPFPPFEGPETLPERLRGLPGLGRFAGFFADVTEGSVRERIRSTYTDDVVFYDTLKEVRGIEALTSYLLRTARNVDRCRVRIEDAVAAGPAELYVRWTMDVRFRRFAGGRSVLTQGMTHLVLSEDGRIARHHDYWDPAAGFYEHVPVLGRVLRWIRSRV